MLRAILVVADSGYEWKDDPEREDRKMVIHNMVVPEEFAARYVPCLFSSRGPWKHYDPFVQEPDLFLRLAYSEPTLEGIQKFANRYGGICQRYSLRHKWMRERGRLLEWQAMILDMRFLVDLWRAYTTRDRDRLGRFVHWNGKKLRRTRRGDDLFEQFLTKQMAPFERKTDEDEAEFYKPGDLIAPARGLLFHRVQRALEVLTFRAALANESLELLVTADSLREIVLAQFALAVVERWELKSCQRCGLPFSEAETRVDRAFCSDSCRVLACRDRKKRAVELGAQGVGLRKIVEEVGSDLQTVKNWLKAKESPRGTKTKRKR